MIKRFDSNRIERVLWKIVRGLHFHHITEVLSANWRISWSLTTREEPGPTEHFKLFRDLPGNEPLGDYPGVFTYRVQHFSETEISLRYWALLIWDSILVTIQFHDPACRCSECMPNPV
jgi:hypothetical protein